MLINSSAMRVLGEDKNTHGNRGLSWAHGLYWLGEWGWGLSVFQMGYKVAAAIFSPVVPINPRYCSHHALRWN